MASSITNYLQRHGINPTPRFSEEWARDNWHDWKAVEEQLKVAGGHIKDEKGKEIICKMLGTCLEAACQDRKNLNREKQDLRGEIRGRKAAELLLSLKIERLQKQLQEQKEKKQKLKEKVQMMLMQTSHPPDILQIRKLIASTEKQDGNTWGDPDHSKQGKNNSLFPSNPPEYEARPTTNIKQSQGSRSGVPRCTVRATAWDPLQLANIREKFSRKPGETETEYLWRVCITGGDQIKLSGNEANGFWGPRVFLNLGPNPANGSHSITSRVAYWAGGIDATERGEPSIIPIRSLNELSTAITKAACIQAMHKRESNDIPITATIDYVMLKPLLRGAPAVLKPYLIAKRHKIKRDTECKKGLGNHDPCIQLPTWAELMYSIINRAREMGWDDLLAGKSDPRPRTGDQVRPIKQTPSQGTGTRPRENMPKDPKVEPRDWRHELCKKALALGIPTPLIQRQPAGIVLSLIEAFQKRDNSERKEHITTSPVPVPRKGDNTLRRNCRSRGQKMSNSKAATRPACPASGILSMDK